MAYDPISPPTRRSRSAMLVFATSLLAVTAFQVEVSSLSGLAVQIDFPPGTVKTLLGAATLYFILTFSVSLYEDLEQDVGRKLDVGATAQELKHLRNLAMQVPKIMTVSRSAHNGSSPSINDLDVDVLRSGAEAAKAIYSRYFSDREKHAEKAVNLARKLQAVEIHRENPILPVDAQMKEMVTEVSEVTANAVELLTSRLATKRNAAVYTKRLILVEILMPGIIVVLSLLSWCSEAFRHSLSGLFIEEPVQTAYIELLKFNLIT